MDRQWNEIEVQGKKLPQWKRTFIVDEKTSRGLVAAALNDDAKHFVWACASSDGIPTYTRNNHCYVPADWMASKFLQVRPLCELVIASACS